jgi:hypothetical protein
MPDVFVEQAAPSQMVAEAGLDAPGIVNSVFLALGMETRRTGRGGI